MSQSNVVAGMSRGRRRARLLFRMSLVAALAVGCSDPPSADRDDAAPPEQVIANADASEFPLKAQDAVDAPAAVADASVPEAVVTPPAPPVDPPSAADAPPRPDRPPAPPDWARHPDALARFLLVTTEGPLLLEASMTIHGRPFRQPFRELIDRALEQADANRDGVGTWDELLSLPFVRYGGFGNPAVSSDADKRRIIQEYDRDSDGRVDRSEIPSFLTRNQAQSRSFRFVSSNRDRYRNRSDSRLRLALDEDLNGRLSPEEIAAAPTKFREFDSDEDEILRREEISAPGPADAMMQDNGPLTQSDPNQPESALSLDFSGSWDLLSYTLRQMYALGGDIAQDDFRLDPSLYSAINGDAEERLSRRDLSLLKDVRPHVRLAIDFAPDTGDSTLTLLDVSPALQPARIVRQSASRATLLLPRLTIAFFLNDQAVTARDQAAQAQAQFDANRDGYITMEEAPEGGLAAVFGEIDSDGDEKLFPNELEAFLAQQPQAFNSQVQARAGESEDAVFTWLDQDLDGRLGAQEVLRASDRINELDADGDGFVGVDDFPESYLFGVIRCGPGQDNQAFVSAIRSTFDGAPRDLPEWMTNMDVNRDGVLTPREFLGPRSQFDSLDGDGDGFLAPTELAR